MTLGRRQRRILVVLGLVVGGVTVLLLAMPVWFPWVLGPLARRAGARYSGYHREGYSHFRVDGFSYTNDSVQLTAASVECMTPMAWLWRLTVGSRKEQKTFLSLNHWSLESISRTENARPASISSDFETLTGGLQILRRWAPRVVLSNGIVQVQNTVIALPAVTWSEGRLQSELQVPSLRQQALLIAQVSNAPPYTIQVQLRAADLDSELVLSTNAAGLSLRSTNLWWNNPVEFQAQFGQTGTLPEEASLEAPNFQLPAALVGLPQYEAIKGSLSAKWHQGAFALELTARAQPEPSQTDLPPLDVELHVRGDTNRAVIETANVTSPWVRARLSRELALYFTGPLLHEPARLSLTADLGGKHWFGIEGTLQGEAEFSPAPSRFPEARLQLSGSGIGTPEFKAKTFEMTCSVDWPWLRISEARAQFDDGSNGSLAANLDITNRLVESGHFSFDGPLAGRWLPSGYSYQALAASGEFEGPLTNLNHSGHLLVTNLTSPGLRPLQIALDWRGRQENLRRAALTLAADGTSLSVEGSAEIASTGAHLLLEALTLRKAGEPQLTLSQPTRLSFEFPSGGSALSFALVEPLQWAGLGGDLSLQAALTWPASGALRISAHGLHSVLLEEFLKSPLLPVEIHELNLQAAWTNAPVNLSFQLSASDAERVPLEARLSLTGDGTGLSLQEIKLTSASTPVVTANGFVPLILNPASTSGVVQIESRSPLRLTAAAGSEAVLWDKIADWTGVRLGQPDLTLELDGTWLQPRGRIRLQVQQIQAAMANPPLPSLRDLHMELIVNRQKAQLVDGRLLVQDQPVSLTGEVPLGDDFWENLARDPLPYLEKASAHLQMEKARLAAFAELDPSLLSPQGELTVDLSLLPGLKLDGQLTLENGRTRPVPSLGPIRDIAVNIRFRERLLVLQSATANVGGSTIEMTGVADLNPTNLLKKQLPPFSFVLSGTNVPLVRQPEAIMRGDLLLSIVKTNGAEPLLSGLVNLRDSYYLSALSSLVPGKIATPSQRPPYFSVTNSLLADWRLGVHVTGDNFLRVRTTVFNGEVSANLQVQGTLKGPVAVGEAKIGSGVVTFPFGSLQVQNGFVTLTAQNPYRPQLSVTATTEQFGYNLKMQVTGPTDSPVVEFSSTPPLTSEQILLLLTAGEMPQGTFSLTPQQRAQTLAVFLGGDLLAKLGIVGLGESRLTVRSGQEISETGKPTYSVEFKLNNDWSLVAEYDRFGDYNMGVQWRVYSK